MVTSPVSANRNAFQAGAFGRCKASVTAEDEVVEAEDERFFDAILGDAVGERDNLGIVRIDRLIKRVVFRGWLDLVDRQPEKPD